MKYKDQAGNCVVGVSILLSVAIIFRWDFGSVPVVSYIFFSF